MIWRDRNIGFAALGESAADNGVKAIEANLSRNSTPRN
jgi:hypothetical protein